MFKFDESKIKYSEWSGFGRITKIDVYYYDTLVAILSVYFDRDIFHKK